LEEFVGHSISNDQLRHSIALANENRSLLREFYRQRAQHPGKFSGAEILALVKTATILPKEEHTAKLKKLLRVAKERPPLPRDGVRLFLVGSVCDQAQVFDLFEAGGASIVGDDLCTGWRYFGEDVVSSGDPLDALADRFLRKVPCPCKYNPGFDRGEELLERVAASRAQGVIFILLKFCDPHAFDYPYLKGKLEEANLPSLLLEIEPGGLPLGAVETRLKAFAETLGG
jgi:benzoyl-CoA reductase/2-hydroxyglutaryl-CoA dehydratase subunit BcrC/BadD/HgdB